jgi:hypothetical protein
MNLLPLFALLGIVGLLVILFVVSRRRRQSSIPSAVQLRVVDMLAFRNLVDPEEEAYLRRCVLPSQFHALQRARMRAAADYIKATIHNSGVLLQVGQAAALSTEPSVAASGKELIQIALRLRILALLALAKVYLRILMPGAPLSVGRLAERYHDATGLAARLLLLQKLRAA